MRLAPTLNDKRKAIHEWLDPARINDLGLVGENVTFRCIWRKCGDGQRCGAIEEVRLAPIDRRYPFAVHYLGQLKGSRLFITAEILVLGIGLEQNTDFGLQECFPGQWLPGWKPTEME